MPGILWGDGYGSSGGLALPPEKLNGAARCRGTFDPSRRDFTAKYAALIKAEGFGTDWLPDVDWCREGGIA